MSIRIAAGALLVMCAGSFAVAGDDGVSLRIIPGDTYAARAVTGPYEQIAGAFGEIGEWLTQYAGQVKVSGHALSVFYDDPKALPAEKLRSEARIPITITGDLPAGAESGPVRVHHEPARLALRAVHYGPVGTIAATFGDLFHAIAGRGLRYVAPSQHVYLVDLKTTPPAQQRTEARIIVEPTGPTDLGIYAGRGAFGPMLVDLSDAAGAGKLSFRPISAEEITDGKLAKRCRALVMPGGWAGSYNEDLGKAGAKRIKSFLARGNGYLGICAGAYFAAGEIVWEGETLPYLLDLFPGVPVGPIAGIAPWPKEAVTKITVDPKHQVTKGLGGERTVLYYGGPVLEAKKGAKVKVLARYAEGGGPAVVAFARGRGRVLLSGVHLETRRPDDPESDRDLLLAGLRWILRN